MKITTSTIDLERLRAVVTRPTAEGAWPAIVAYPDIFQLTPSHLRLTTRLAGHGFVVVSPEIYSHLEGRGAVFDFDADRQRALDASAKVDVDELDADIQSVLDHVAPTSSPEIEQEGEKAGSSEERGLLRSLQAGRRGVGVLGWCFGGHVAFRAALDPRVRAAACCYPTGLHDGSLGKRKVDTLERCAEMKGDLLLTWGRDDPHVPAPARAKIHGALDAAGARYEARFHDAEHAFMRDVGPRFDPGATD
ncbi:MAG TPA: dienelactone hydrolase family protein, partial [Byssovorax sp.]